MNIVYISEQGFIGKIPDDAVSYRSDLAWIKMLDAFHLPYSEISDNPEADYYSVVDTADVLLFVPSKKNQKTIEFALYWKQKGKCIGVVQEGPKGYWQNYSTRDQLKYLALIKVADVIMCHNEADKIYFESLSHAPVIVFRTVQDVDYWKPHRLCPREKDESVFIGGNMCEWYGGMHSYCVASLESIKKIMIASMGRKQSDEEDVMKELDKRIEYLPYLDWANFMHELNKSKYAVHMMPASAAGSFSMNCGALGVPCIGNIHNDTQRLIFPELSVEPDDLTGATLRLKKLIEDRDFYDEVVTYALKKIEEFSIVYNKKDILKKLKKAIKNE